MMVTTTLPVLPAPTVSADAKRTVVYATSRLRGSVDDYVRIALEGLRAHADRLIVVACGDPGDEGRRFLSGVSDVMTTHPSEFDPSVYADALAAVSLSDVDEIVLTGDSWFGPIGDFGPVLERMSDRKVHFWEMVENRSGVPREFPAQGFPAWVQPWTWTVVRRELFSSPVWSAYWAARRSSSECLVQESGFARHFSARGFTGATAFDAADFANDDPALLTPELLVQAGCPLLKRLAFTLYPPLLHQFAFIGRDVLAAVEQSGYGLSPVWQNLARTIPPKALNTNAGMLEVIPAAGPLEPVSARRMVAVAHVSEIDQAPELLRRLGSLPAGFDLVITTSDGRKATSLMRLLEKKELGGWASVDIRVTPANRGRDMSDFFIACRDVLAPGRYDLVVKIHARPKRRKTLNVRRYFRRYQLENLLASPDHVAGILALFDREPGLGMVFPPMMHIGYATMGRAWGDYRDAAVKLFERLGVSVPLDNVSPLAPYGGMWIARPDALRLMASQRWLYRDYGKPGRKLYRDLARLQERTVVYAAAELGYHCRTVLTPEHAAISHTALEFKVDQLFSTTRGYPVDQIELIQRAGETGYGGVVGLSRMYLRLNHPRIARLVLPLLAAAQWMYGSVRAMMGDERFIKERNPWRDEDL